MAYDEDELRRQKRRRCLRYILIFAVFQILVILIFSLTVLRLRTPKFRVTSAAFDTFDYSAAAGNPSFNARMNVELAVKNPNFGRYEFRSTYVTLYYNGEPVGTAFVPGSQAGVRSTKRFVVAAVVLSSAGLLNRAGLASGLNSGVLILNSRSILNGKVEFLGVLKRKKSAEMDCEIMINLAQRMVGYLNCN